LRLGSENKPASIAIRGRVKLDAGLDVDAKSIMVRDGGA